MYCYFNVSVVRIKYDQFNNDKEETIDQNNIPKDIRQQCSLKNDPSKIIAKSNLINFRNKLTFETTGVQKYQNYVEYLKVGGTNTSKHPKKCI